MLGVEEPQVERAARLDDAVKPQVHQRALTHPGVAQHLVGTPVEVVEPCLVGRRVELGQLAVIEVLGRALKLVADA